MLIVPTQFKDKVKFDPQTVLSEIDKKVSQWSDTLLNNIRFGFNHKINYNDVNTLLVLKGVFLHIINGDESYSICWDEVVSKIYEITNKTC